MKAAYYTALNRDIDWQEGERPRFTDALQELFDACAQLKNDESDSAPEWGETIRWRSSEVSRGLRRFSFYGALPGSGDGFMEAQEDLQYSFEYWLYRRQDSRNSVPRLRDAPRLQVTAVSSGLPSLDAAIGPLKLPRIEYALARPQLNERIDQVLRDAKAEMLRQADEIDSRAQLLGMRPSGRRREPRKGALRLYRNLICGMTAGQSAKRETDDAPGEDWPESAIDKMVRSWKRELQVESDGR